MGGLLPEGEVVQHVDDVAAVVFVLFPQMFQYSDLLPGYDGTCDQPKKGWVR